MATHRIKYRELLPQERACLRRQGRTPLGALAVYFLLFTVAGATAGVIAAALLAPGIAWVMRLFGREAGASVMIWLMIALGAAGLGASLVLFGRVCRFMLRERRNARDDLRGGYAQIIHVIEPDVVQQSERNDEGPILYFNIGDGLLLVLMGQWLYDAQTYGAPDDADDDEIESDHLNGQPEPHGFPSSEFEFSRGERSGEVFSIKVLGTYQKPGRLLGPKDVPLEITPMSEVFQGSIDELATAVRTLTESRRRARN